MVADRSEINTALSKVLAYQACGKDGDAKSWARKLVTLLECADILTPETRGGVRESATPVPGGARRLTPVRQPLRRTATR